LARGKVLARHDGDLSAGAPKPLSLDEVLALLGSSPEGHGLSRDDAIACYLSAGDGWREAVKKLGGAFAEGATGLNGRKAD
jgi:hypothetical protein